VKRATYGDTLRACFIAYGSEAIVNNLLPLFFVIFRNQFGISYSMIAQLILANFATQFFVDIVAAKYVDKIGHRISMVFSHICLASGLILLAVLPNVLANAYVGMLIAVMTYSVGSAIAEVLVSPIVELLPSEAKTARMSLLHSFYSWGQVVTILASSLAIGLIGAHYWYLLPMVWALVPIYNIYNFARVPLVPPIPEGRKMSTRGLFRSRLFLISLVLMLCAGATEMVMSQWTSLFAEVGLGVSKVVGDLLGPCLFALFMGIGRTWFGTFGEKLNLSKSLALCTALALACMVTVVLAPIPMVSLLACALTGIGVSIMWPGMFSLSAQLHPRGGTMMFAALALAGDVGCAVGPWVVGRVSDLSRQSGAVLDLGARLGLGSEQAVLRFGLLVAVIFPLLMLAGIASLRRRALAPEYGVVPAISLDM
jgi:fucose permease